MSGVRDTAGCALEPGVDTHDVTRIEFETGNPDSGAMRAGYVSLAPGLPSSNVACVHSVPGLMTAADFCKFVGQYNHAMRHMRMLRPKNEKNKYMVLAKFDTQADAVRFAKAFQGKDFLVGLQLEEKCSVSAVISAAMDVPEEETKSAAEGSGEAHFPGFLLFPDAPVECPKAQASSENKDSSVAGPVVQSSENKCSGTCHGGTEAKCPVCQDSLEGGSGEEGVNATLVTTLCNHTMHADCLSKWSQDNCPVCRHAHELVPEASACMECGESRGLWMCIVCAFVGCGFYEQKHAEKHSQDTHHPFVINIQDYKFSTGDQIAAGSVWDYTSKRFVQRLVSSEDGKVVEVTRDTGADTRGSSSAAAGSGGNSRAGGVGMTGTQIDGGGASSKKSIPPVDSVVYESEEDDRGFRAAIYASNMDARVSEYRSQLESLDSEHKASQVRYAELEQALMGRLSEQDKELEEANATVTQLHDELKACKKQLARKAGDADKEGKALKEKNAFLKSLNESLLRDKRGWNEEVDRLGKKLAEKEAECTEKEEQLRDMMLHLEAQAKVAEASSSGCRVNAGGSGSEACGGDILGVGPTPKERLARKTRRR